MTSAEPVVVTAYFRPLPESRSAVLVALHEAIPRVHEEEGCELYAIHDAPDGSIVMLEKWSSAAELDAHSTGAPVAALVAALEGHLAGPVEVTRLAPLPVGDARRGAL